MSVIDTHIHISHYLYNNEFPYLSLEEDNYVLSHGTREDLISRLQHNGVTVCIDPAISIKSNQVIIENAKKHPGYIYTSVGVHPKRTFKYNSVDSKNNKTNNKLHWKERKKLDEYALNDSVVAIGETGLDYSFNRSEQHRLRQKAWFLYQINLANKMQLPLILHIRDAHKDAIQILKRNSNKIRGGVCHCFTGTPQDADEYVKLNIMLGIGCALLKDSPKKHYIEEAVVQTPLSYILLETDGPYVKPDCTKLTRREQKKARNTSLVLPAVAKRIAELKGLTTNEVIEKTTENAKELFRFNTH